MSVAVSGDFCRFKLASPSLLFLSKDEVKAAHSDFDCCPRESGLRSENPPDRPFFSAILYDLKLSHPGTCLDTKTPHAFRWKRAFYTYISMFAALWLYSEQSE